ncbi:MAG: kynureninase, partial [Gemmatimonadales bacterium]
MTATSDTEFEPGEAGALRLDDADPLVHFRERFAIPRDASGEPLVYLSGNSLGLMPRAARDMVNGELDDWATLGVEGHFEGRRPWFSYHEQFREPGARLVGAVPGEVVMMNSLTVNLHLMLVTFYQPEGRRRKILMEAGSFPSDRYAVTTHLRTRGLDPAEALIEAHPREGEDCLRTADIEAILADLGEEIALVMLGGV